MLGMPEPKRLEAAGRSHPMVSTGSGSPVLFVHGGWADLRVWCGLWREISTAHEFMAVTQRHFGQDNGNDTTPFSLSVHTNDLIAILRKIGKPVHLVGWSYSSAILLRAAIQVPDLVQKVVVYEPSFEFEALIENGNLRIARESFRKEFEPTYDIARTGDLRAAIKYGTEVNFGLGRGGFEQLEQDIQTVFLDNAHTIMLDILAEPAEPLTAAELNKVVCPTLIIRGMETHARYRIMADQTCAALPNAYLLEIPGFGHGGPVQAPGLLAQAVLDFLDTSTVTRPTHVM
jgi:pimeloyl-ACP methyl ester carboxylesterase